MGNITKVGTILLSGGLDSTTVAAYAVRRGYELSALTVDYGQKHRRELEAAKKVAALLGIKHEIVDLSSFRRLAWYSALTSGAQFGVPKGRDSAGMDEDIPITYVPLRNTLFITLAAAFLESRVLEMIEGEKVNPGSIRASIFIAANAVDYSGYPDCRPEYYRAMAAALYRGSKLGAQYGKKMGIKTPVITKSKAEIVRMAMALKAPLEHTWSCYEGGDFPCGQCDSCRLRAKGFAEAGLEDPLLARLGGEKKREG